MWSEFFRSARCICANTREHVTFLPEQSLCGVFFLHPIHRRAPPTCCATQPEMPHPFYPIPPTPHPTPPLPLSSRWKSISLTPDLLSPPKSTLLQSVRNAVSDTHARTVPNESVFLLLSNWEAQDFIIRVNLTQFCSCLGCEMKQVVLEEAPPATPPPTTTMSLSAPKLNFQFRSSLFCYPGCFALVSL